MKPEIKAAWIAALRSGDYDQGREKLRTGDQFCCLGVLCDIASKQGLGEWIPSGEFKVGDRHELLLPPQAIADWAELGDINPRVGPVFDDEWRYGLSDWNDGAQGNGDDTYIDPHTFADIADLIEKDL